MTRHHSVKIQAHRNIYTKKARFMRLDYAVPKKINEETGIILLVPGYLGHIDSKVYKKMRLQFAELYNAVVVQCDYFGQRFMQKPAHFLEQDGFAVLEETIHDFNDMGWMQMLDLIWGVRWVQHALQLKSQRVIGYGHSHGAYLLYGANRLYSQFSYIVDNSARLRTDYFKKQRVEEGVLFTFRAGEFVKNTEALDLAVMLNEPQITQVLSFQGDADVYVDHAEKKEVLSIFPHLQYELITQERIGEMFQSNTHGLDADFLAVFAYAMSLERTPFHSQHASQQLVFDRTMITIQDEEAFPIFLFSYQ